MQNNSIKNVRKMGLISHISWLISAQSHLKISHDWWRLQICAHTHTRTHVPTHTQLISRNGKEIEITHTLAKWGSLSRKKKVKFSAGVDTRSLEKLESHCVRRTPRWWHHRERERKRYMRKNISLKKEEDKNTNYAP